MYYTLTYDRDESSLRHLHPQLPSCITIASIYTTCFTTSERTVSRCVRVYRLATPLEQDQGMEGAGPISRYCETASRDWIGDASARRARRAAVVGGRGKQLRMFGFNTLFRSSTIPLLSISRLTMAPRPRDPSAAPGLLASAFSFVSRELESFVTAATGGELQRKVGACHQRL